MFEFIKKIPDFYWAGEVYQPAFEPSGSSACLELAHEFQGQFSLAHACLDGKLFLLRDRLGINKLFFAIHDSGNVIAGNYLIDLVRRGIPFEAIHSVPSGHVVEIDSAQHRLTLHKFRELRNGNTNGHGFDEDVSAGLIRAQLEQCFSKLAKHFAPRTICVNVSGGLDSGVISALARRHFSNVIGFTYGFTDEKKIESEDVRYARRLTDYLGIPLRVVSAGSQDIFAVLEDALCYGQDWRDFNVHCAVVNEILSPVIKAEADSRTPAPPLLLSGDLMNEYLADYTPVEYRGRQFYSLPQVGIAELRLTLVRGLDTGDREIGVFNQHGLQLIQPYGLILDHYLDLPPDLLIEPGFKQRFVKKVAGDLLPPFIFERGKVRAQIGTSGEPDGILPILVDSGHDAKWMRSTFCRIFGLQEEGFLNRFIRAGLYRFLWEYPKGRIGTNGYYM